MRFDTEARIAVAQATDLAHELGHDQVGPDHLLLGLLANLRGPACAALSDHGLRFNAARDLVVAHHVDTPAPAPGAEADHDHDAPGRLDEDREALRAIGIDLDRVREAVRENLGADLTDGWGSRPDRGRRGRRGPRHDDRARGRGRRGPRSSRPDGVGFSPELRDLLHDVRRSALRERFDDTERGRRPAMSGTRLLGVLLRSANPAVRAVLGTASDLDGLRTRVDAGSVRATDSPR